MSDIFKEELNNEDINFLTTESISRTLDQYEILRVPKSIRLKDCLDAYRKDYLYNLALENGLDVKKSWTKNKILNKMTDRVNSTMEERVLLLDDEQIDLLKKFINFELDLTIANIEVARFYLTVFPIAVKMGLLFSFYNDEIMNTVASDELKHILNHIDSIKEKHLKKPFHIKQLDDLLKASVHLYGITSKERLLDCWKIRFPDFMYSFEFYETVNNLIAVLAIKNNYHFANNDFIASYEFVEFEDASDYYYDTFYRLAGDYYTPTKKEIQYYEKNTFDRQSLVYKRLKQLISKYSSDSRFVMEIIEFHITFGNDFSNTMHEINEYELLEFETEKEVKRFAELYFQLHNHSRMWRFHGYTPMEMEDKGVAETVQLEGIDTVIPTQDPEKRENLIPFPSSFESDQAKPVRVSKVGRKDPCPCGSGKKYKKCCGR